MEPPPNSNAPTERQGSPRPPDRRHFALRLNRRTPRHTNQNTVIMPWVDVPADVQAIRNGHAHRDGNVFTVQGRTYVLEPGGRPFPTEGEGFHRLNRGAYRALALYNDRELSVDANWMLDLEGVSFEDRETARRLMHDIEDWRRER